MVWCEKEIENLLSLIRFNLKFGIFLKGSRDNMSIVIVTFPGAPKMVPEEVEKDNICNEKIENRIKGM